MYNLLKLNLARNSLRYIIRTYNIKKLHIPYYLCKVIRESVIRENCLPVFYHIDDNFLPEKEFPENDFILYPNYFGICDKNVDVLAKKYKHLIVDNAHSFYSEPKGFATFNSVRKFLPVYNGSYLWIKNQGENFETEKYNDFIPKTDLEKEKTEIEFLKSEVLFLSKQAENEILQYKKYENRLESFKKIHEKYGAKNLLNIDINSVSCPFCYPFWAENEKIANDMAENLKKKNITIYRYWDYLPQDFNEYKFYSRLVAIPLTDCLF